MADWQAGLVLLAGVPLIWALMYAGWRARRRRQAGVAQPLTSPPSDFLADLLPDTPGVYVSTVVAGDWLNRVVAHGLGVRSEASLSVGGQGVRVSRSGAPGIFIPVTDLVGVRRDRGQAGKYTIEEGLLVITWRLGEDIVDTGFRPRSWADIAGVQAGLAALLATPPGGTA